MSRIKLLLDVVEDMRALADSIQAVASAMGQVETENVQQPEQPREKPQKQEAPAISLDHLRSRLGEISRAGYTSSIQTLIQRYGVTHLSKVDPKDYATLLRDAEELLNGT